METFEQTLDDESSFSTISEKEPLNLQNFINSPFQNDEQSLEEMNKEDKQRYFVNKSILNESKNKITTINKNDSHLSTPSDLSNIPKILFNTSIKCTNKFGKQFVGRKRKSPITCIEEERIHDNLAKDNVTRRIQVYAMNSMIQFVNEIISKIDIGLENIPIFKKIDYSFKQNINSDIFEENKKKTIENFLETEISPKYKTFSSDSNKKEKEKIKKNAVIKNILSMTYIDFFKEIFYENKRIIDLSKYGLKKIINLSTKVKTYENMFNEKTDENYRKRAAQIIRKKFLL